MKFKRKHYPGSTVRDRVRVRVRVRVRSRVRIRDRIGVVCKKSFLS